MYSSLVIKKEQVEERQEIPVEVKSELKEVPVEVKSESKEGIHCPLKITNMNSIGNEIEHRKSIKAEFNDVKKKEDGLNCHDVKIKTEIHHRFWNKTNVGASESDLDLRHPTGKELHQIKQGIKKVSFNYFKILVEHGILKNGDFANMMSVREVNVPGRGEVIQFLESTMKDHNKINLKELGIDDVVSCDAKKSKKSSKNPFNSVHNVVYHLVSKQGLVFTCGHCGTEHLNSSCMLIHIREVHGHSYFLEQLKLPGSFSKAQFKGKEEKMFWNAVKVAVGRVNDPCLRVEQVVIKNSTLKKELKSGHPKNEERNVYQKAANLLSTVIHMTKFEFEKGSQYFCKMCGNSLEQEKLSKRERKIYGGKTFVVDHIASWHPDILSSWLPQLGLSPGPQVTALLCEALKPGLMMVEWKRTGLAPSSRQKEESSEQEKGPRSSGQQPLKYLGLLQ